MMLLPLHDQKKLRNALLAVATRINVDFSLKSCLPTASSCHFQEAASSVGHCFWTVLDQVAPLDRASTYIVSSARERTAKNYRQDFRGDHPVRGTYSFAVR
jgi:hypothetical protein